MTAAAPVSAPLRCADPDETQPTIGDTGTAAARDESVSAVPIAIPAPAGLERYDGGKGGSGVAEWIINQIPPHKIYVEAFVGGGAVLRKKRPADNTVVIDADASVVDAWRRAGLLAYEGDAPAWVWRFNCGFESAVPIAADSFIYCDPPYLMETRSCKDALYRHEFSTIEDHTRLLTVLRQLRCSVAISGYASSLYSTMLKDWRCSTFWTVDRRGRRRQEHLWMNYPEPVELHDWRYFGKNFTDRQRFKRKVSRWRSRLANLPTLERAALLHHLTR